MHYLLGLYEIDPAEAADILADLLVVLVVDDPGDPPDGPSGLIQGKPVGSFADFERLVLLRVEGVHVH